ncbi:MAG: CopG family transcriptional regulator [Sulfurimonas sp.]|jgi:predicted transcriptional regulator|nr:CopG family transcriptional regulator [Sulfurimonadaceae bacterium]
MIATVRLDEHLEATLSRVSKMLNKKKSEVIREAIGLYAQKVEQNRKTKILNAIKKTKEIDKKEFEDFEETMDDGL